MPDLLLGLRDVRRGHFATAVRITCALGATGCSCARKSSSSTRVFAKCSSAFLAIT